MVGGKDADYALTPGTIYGVVRRLAKKTGHRVAVRDLRLCQFILDMSYTLVFDSLSKRSQNALLEAAAEEKPLIKTYHNCRLNGGIPRLDAGRQPAIIPAFLLYTTHSVNSYSFLSRFSVYIWYGFSCMPDNNRSS